VGHIVHCRTNVSHSHEVPLTISEVLNALMCRLVPNYAVAEEVGVLASQMSHNPTPQDAQDRSQRAQLMHD